MDDFQCVFAESEGAVTAPATGLHFTREMLKRMEISGIQNAFITLHCGLGNFNDIEVEDLTKHKMDSEQMEITAETCRIVNEAKRAREIAAEFEADGIVTDKKPVLMAVEDFKQHRYSILEPDVDD